MKGGKISLALATGAFLSALLCAAPPLLAGEVAESVGEAAASYKAGELSAAVESMEYARALVLQEKSARLAAFLPPPPPGWEVMETGGEGGRMATASRMYRRGQSMMHVNISTDVKPEPPSFLEEESPCAKAWAEARAKLPVVEIGRRKALVDFEEKERSGSISVEEEGLSVDVMGNGVSKDEIMRFFQSIDIDGIAAMK